MVVQGGVGAEVIGATAVAVTLAPERLDVSAEGATVGIRVIVEGMAVTMPGF